MEHIYWLGQTEADVPAEDGWLSAGESDCLKGMRIPKRRADWRLGRWTAKCAVASFLDLPADSRTLTEIEIRPASSGAPEVFIADDPAAVMVSISHSSGASICAVAPRGVDLGCDLEVIDARSDAFIADYFTKDEQALVARAREAERSQLVTLLWSAKESALKALREGLRLDTRSVAVSPPDEAVYPSGWRPLRVCADGRNFEGWWQQAHGFVRTFVADPPLDWPTLLPTPTHSPNCAARSG